MPTRVINEKIVRTLNKYKKKKKNGFITPKYAHDIMYFNIIFFIQISDCQ